MLNLNSRIVYFTAQYSVFILTVVVEGSTSTLSSHSLVGGLEYEIIPSAAKFYSYKRLHSVLYSDTYTNFSRFNCYLEPFFVFIQADLIVHAGVGYSTATMKVVTQANFSLVN